MIYYTKLDGNKISGFYIESFHGKELCESLNHIKIDEELHSYIIDFGLVAFNGLKEDKLYTIEDKDSFCKEEPEPVVLSPTVEDRLAALEQLMLEAL